MSSYEERDHCDNLEAMLNLASLKTVFPSDHEGTRSFS